MSIGAIGSTPSFWQQDQSYWQQAQSNDSSVAASDSVINAMSSAETSLGKGLASIANKTALNRVNSELTAAIQNILSGNTGSSSSSSSATSSSSSGTPAAPAIGTGTAAVTLSTPLSTLGVLAGGSITVSAGAYTTTYTSTGTDTVGNLIYAINQDQVGNAPVTASLNSDGRLVLTGKNDTDTITVGGVYAANIGFGASNDSFKPTAGTASSTSTDSSTGTSSTSSTSSASTSSSTSKSRSYSTVASETASDAASVLSDSGAGGLLVDMLA
jgi:trimeric autotransporter adhesin